MRGQAVAKYTLNVQPEDEHELTDAEAADLRSLGFTVTAVGDGSDAEPDGGDAAAADQPAVEPPATPQAESAAVTTRKAASGRTSTTKKEGV